MTAEWTLRNVQVAAPYPVRWSSMKGDARVRFCDKCQLHVYNLSAMSAEVAADFVTQREGRVCVRFFRRRDGTMLTADCPVGATINRVRWVGRLACALALGLSSLCGAGYLVTRNGKLRRDECGGSVRDLVNWVKIQIGVETRKSIAFQASFGCRDIRGSLPDVFSVAPPPMSRFADPSDPEFKPEN
jgi:hypothetical protein